MSKSLAAVAFLVTILGACSQAPEPEGVAEEAVCTGGVCRGSIPALSSSSAIGDPAPTKPTIAPTCGVLGNPCDDGITCCEGLRCLSDESSPTSRRCSDSYADSETTESGCW